MRATELEERINDLCVNIEHGTLPDSIIEERLESHDLEISHLTLDAIENLSNRISGTKLGVIITRARGIVDNAKDRIIEGTTGLIDGVATIGVTAGRMLQKEPMAAIQNYMNHLSRRHEFTNGESTRKMMRSVAYYEYLSTGTGDVEDLPKSIQWLHKKSPRAAEGFSSFLGKSIEGTFIDDLYGYYAKIHKPLAKAIPGVERSKMRDAQNQRIDFDIEHTAKELCETTPKTQAASSTRTFAKTESTILYEALYALIGDVNSLFAERIATGEFAELGTSMTADECLDRFERCRGDIARELCSSQRQHFLDRTFDDIDFKYVLDIIFEEIFQSANTGTIAIGQHYTSELLTRFKDEFA